MAIGFCCSFENSCVVQLAYNVSVSHWYEGESYAGSSIGQTRCQGLSLLEVKSTDSGGWKVNKRGTYPHHEPMGENVIEGLQF